MAHDGKKVLYFVINCSEFAQIAKGADTGLQALKAEWVAANPDVAEEPIIITSQQATDFNAFATAIKNVMIDNSTIIDQFKAIADTHPTHDANSMGSWG